MTKPILFILTLIAIATWIRARTPAPRKNRAITGTWRVVNTGEFNTVAGIRFDSAYAVFGSYSDTYMRFKYEFIFPDTLQFTDFNQHKYFVTIKKLSVNRLVLDNLFNVEKKMVLERVE